MIAEQETAERCTELGGEAIAPWYALCTRPRHEKSVATQLCERRIESFLPCYSAMHRWKDRNKEVHLPLFPGYVFVRVCTNDRLRVLQLSGAVRFVGFNGSPSVVPEAELQALRGAIETNRMLKPHRYLAAGQRVRVCRGVLQGSEGVLVRSKGSQRLVLSIDLIQRSVAVEVDLGDVVPIASRNQPAVAEIRVPHGPIRTGFAQRFSA